MRFRIRAYRVRGVLEETQCPGCGWPMDEGSRAFEVLADDGGALEAGFCSRSCARRAADDLEREDLRCSECGSIVDDGFTPAVCWTCRDARAVGVAS